MDKPIDNYWKLRLEELKNALEENNFEVFLADDAQEAGRLVLEKIIPELKPNTISWGGSMTCMSAGVFDTLNNNDELTTIDPTDKTVSVEENMERRRQSLLVDLFIAGTNAVTEDGQLVNLDMIGNRIGGITFGPKNVVILIGRNKIVTDLEEAFFRVKDYCGPTNAMRLDKKTPCVKTGYCEECKSPARICNTWTITEKSFPKGRIKVVLINDDLGL